MRAKCFVQWQLNFSMLSNKFCSSELLNPGEFSSFQRAAYSCDILIEEPCRRSFQLVSRVIAASYLQLVNGFEHEGNFSCRLWISEGGATLVGVCPCCSPWRELDFS